LARSKGGGISVTKGRSGGRAAPLLTNLEGCDKVVGVHKDVDDTRGRMMSSRRVRRW
jgi:hypothetical protein